MYWALHRKLAQIACMLGTKLHCLLQPVFALVLVTAPLCAQGLPAHTAALKLCPGRRWR